MLQDFNLINCYLLCCSCVFTEFLEKFYRIPPYVLVYYLLFILQNMYCHPQLVNSYIYSYKSFRFLWVSKYPLKHPDFWINRMCFKKYYVYLQLIHCFIPVQCMNYFIHWINTDIMNSLTLVFFQTKVISILNGTSNGDLFARGWVDDKEDPNVGSLFQLIREDPKKTLRSSDARYQRWFICTANKSKWSLIPTVKASEV